MARAQASQGNQRKLERPGLPDSGDRSLRQVPRPGPTHESESTVTLAGGPETMALTLKALVDSDYLLLFTFDHSRERFLPPTLVALLHLVLLRLLFKFPFESRFSPAACRLSPPPVNALVLARATATCNHSSSCGSD